MANLNIWFGSTNKHAGIVGDQDQPNLVLPIIDEADERRRQRNARDRERYADNSSGVDFTNLSTDDMPDELMGDDANYIYLNVNESQHKRQRDSQGCEVPTENMDPDDNCDWLHRNKTYPAKHMKTSGDQGTPGGVHETVCQQSTLSSSRAAYLTPDERESRRENFRLYNKTPMRKEAKRADNRRRRELQANTLNPLSIAMKNPTYTPTIVHPNSDATEPDGPPVSARNWAIPKLSGTPLFPTSTQTEEGGFPNRCIGRLRNKRHVPYGEKQSLIARRHSFFFLAKLTSYCIK